MRILDGDALAALLDPAGLIDALRAMFQSGCAVPLRHHHTVLGPTGDNTLLLMPAWTEGRFIGIKIVTVFPANGERGLPSVMGSYLLLDGETGQPLAQMDGRQITVRRTAAASALAAGYLARPDAERLLMVGTGQLAPYLIEAHGTIRTIREVLVWGRSFEKARDLAERLTRSDRPVRAVRELAPAVGEADIVSCATLARDPLIRGEWLREGTHIDLVGGFTPDMREADDSTVRRARLFVDTREGALKEAGDIVDPLKRGVISEANVQADLFELTRGTAAGRTSAEEITLFKSVGTALEDLAAAQLAWERAGP